MVVRFEPPAAWAAAARKVIEEQLAIEASRLGLLACREAASPRVVASALLIEGQVIARADAQSSQGGRTVSRRLPREAMGGKAFGLEFSLILGDLVREALQALPVKKEEPVVEAPPPPPVLAAPPPEPVSAPQEATLSLGARAAAEYLAGGGALLLGGDATLRWRPLERVVLELSVGARGAPSASAGLGSVSTFALAAGPAALLTILSGARVAVRLEGFVRVLAISLTGTAVEGATSSGGWGVGVGVGGGGELSVRLGAGRLTLRLGAVGTARGVAATADGARVTGVSGVGPYLSAGGEGWW